MDWACFGLFGRSATLVFEPALIGFVWYGLGELRAWPCDGVVCGLGFSVCLALVALVALAALVGFGRPCLAFGGISLALSIGWPWLPLAWLGLALLDLA